MENNESPLKAGPAVFVVRDPEAQACGNDSAFMQWLIGQGFVNDPTGKLTPSGNPFIYINVKSHVFKHGVWGCKYISTINGDLMTPEDFQSLYAIIQKYDDCNAGC